MFIRNFFQLYVFSVILLFIQVPFLGCQIATLPTSVTNNMASRAMRYHHFIWHNIRNNWNQLSTSSQNEIRGYGWAPPRPARDRNGRPITNNNSGEDFLYMHRQMIATVNRLLRQAGRGPVSGFSSIPPRNDRSFPMPPVYTGPNADLTNLINLYKSDSWYRTAKNVETRLFSTSYLRSVTLGQLGSYIEFASDIHQGLHFRFSARNNFMRVKSSATIPNVATSWDTPRNDWLVDLYSSQVNPWFWKVHGWVDNLIERWRVANNLGTITWRGTWTGGNLNNLPSNLGVRENPNVRFLGNAEKQEEECEDMDMSMNLTALEEVGKILIREGSICDFYSDLDKEMTAKDLKRAKVLRCPNLAKKMRL